MPGKPRPTSLRPRDLSRVARVVRDSERGDRNIHAHVSQPMEDSEPVRLCKTSALWAKGQAATLTVWEGGGPLTEQSSSWTLVAYNKFGIVLANRFVIVARAGNGKWYLMSAEC